MNNIAILDSNVYGIKPTQPGHIGKVVEDNGVYSSGSDTVQSFTALATQPGIMTSILQGQRLMVNFDARPALSVPAIGQRKINAENSIELMKLTASLKGGDINKLERAAASAATVFNTQDTLLQTAGHSHNGNKSVEIPVSSLSSATHPIHSQAVLEGGTDITSVDASGNHFINVMGDMKMMVLNNQLTVTLTKQEAELASSAAKSSQRVVEAAARAGTKSIDAEKQRMMGTITSGTLGIVGQGVTATRTMKALKNESNSIGNNLAGATNVEGQQSKCQSSIKTATAKLPEGATLSNDMGSAMGGGFPSTTSLGTEKRSTHTQMQLKTNYTRVGSDYGNTITQTGQKVIDGSFNVEAANETKKAELARADQSVNNEIASTHQQMARKSAESKAILSQVFENTINNNNSAVSSVADRMR